ncbi:MAG: autotransporter domain-containing protein [Gammaproteobacteria bacterium]|nr:autotransporter domain-containing protein [Gammaproteobacteria bacterium]MBU1492081.1 autotransporter domain-containing protein [Gammaproteobacteria bacterium]MBU2139275.1 autotransporter domain-containing protein [Gammaproteobacteria bacterium]MBU2216623.1 autotransporter domain-containing protein [Gammaproteobacteria bacterium]MBU2324344.1 autotransporter domain-containing protein [Gammaproteobacteria bacterium]
MNQAFRVVWSNARSTFVVVDEYTSARGKRGGCTRLLTSVALALTAAGTAQAAPGICGAGNNTISSDESYSCYLYGNDSLTVTESGSITTAGESAVFSDNGFGSISNAGEIRNTDGTYYLDGSGIYLQASGSSISNLAGATIEGSFVGITLDGLMQTVTLDSLSNAGTITGATGILATGDVSIGTIINSGTISGIGNDGVGIGIDTGTTIDSVSNSGTINGTLAGIQVYDSTIGVINNSGTISGVQYAISDLSLSGISAINITGNTARLVGDVDAGNSLFTLKSGAVFSNENAISVDRFVIEDGATLRMGAGLSTSSTMDDGIFAFTGFSNAGTLSLAAGVTGTIYGDYTQTSSGALRIGVSDDSTYGKLVVDGTATLASNAKLEVDVSNPGYQFSASTLNNVLSANNLISDGTFAVSDNSQLFNFGAIKDGNTVDLTLTKAASVLDSVISTGNSPAQGAAQVLDNVLSADPTGELASNFVGLTSEQEVSDAVTSTLPTVAGNASNATSSTLAGINRVVQAHQDNNSGLSSGDAVAEGNLWIKTFGSWTEQDQRNGISGYDADTQGLVIGADAAISENTRLGLAFAYAQTDLDNDSRVAPQSVQIDTFQLIGYGSYALGVDTELNFQLDAGQNRSEGKRHMPFADATATADYDGYNVHAGIGIGHNMRLSEQLTFVPSARADYTWIGTDSYREKGAGALNLDVDSNDSEELLLSIDGKLNYALSEATVLSANIGAGYDVIDEDSAITSTYAGAPGAAFKTPGMDMEPWLARTGLGLTHTLAGGTEVSLRYDAEVRSDFTNQGASLKARWAF